MFKKVLLNLFWTGIISGVMGAISVIAVIIYFSYDLPQITSLNDYRPSVPSKIYSKDGTLLAQFGKQDRDIAPYEEMPKVLIDAFISAEDSEFFNHKGVNYLGIIRAMKVNILAGRVVQGGSTITQQVAKSLLLSSERSFTRKIKDFLLALKIEKHLSKEEILFLYLNQVYFGGGYYGVKSAVKGYFNKELNEVSIAESAMIAGLLVAPGKYSPYINPKFARVRQGYVLDRMLANRKVTQEQFDEAKAEKIKFYINKGNPFRAGYFTDWIRQKVMAKVGKEEFFNGGYRVETTLDWGLQKIAQEAVYEGAVGIDKRQGFSGPIGKVENLEEDLGKRRFEFWKNLHRKKSTYFIMDDDNGRIYENNFEEEKVLEFLERKGNESDKLEIATVAFPGNLTTSEENPYFQMLDENEYYEAVVLATSDTYRTIIVDLGGLTGIIPYSGFSWAHPREIKVERVYHPPQTKPGSIVKPGDIVKVKLATKKRKLSKLIYKYSSFNWNFTDDEKELVAGRTYLHFTLEQEPIVQGALVSINPYTSDIVSFVGGTDFNKSQFNRAVQSKRQPGSAYKPLLYASALEHGYTASTLIMDSPESLGGANENSTWKPRNYDGKFKGLMTFRNSLETSRNIPTIKIANDVGVDKIVDFSKRIGMKSEIPEDLSLSLGSFGSTLVDIVSVYSIFPNGGRAVNPKAIISVTDRDGTLIDINEKEEIELETTDELLGDTPIETIAAPEVLEEVDGQVEDKAKKIDYLSNLDETQVYDERLAFVMTNILRGVVLHGTGRKARSVSTFLGGKTGTTNNYVDAWFLGFSASVVTGVWTGFDDNQTLGWGETGAKSALPIWNKFMKAAREKFGEKEFKSPPGVITAMIDKKTGKPVKGFSDDSFMETYVEGTEPGAEEDVIAPSTKSNSAAQDVYEDEYFDEE